MPEVRQLAGGKLRLDTPAPHVARVTIDSPAKRNALDRDILDGLASVLAGLDARCLLLTGRGPAFSAGYDIGSLEEAAELVAHPLNAAVAALEALPFPSVAALNGHAIGGGLELALACDLRLAADEARMAMPPARLGLVYSHTGLGRFVDAIGVPRTRELFFTARQVDAATALQWGLVNEVVPAARLASDAVAYAERIAALAPLAQAGNKHVLRALLDSRRAIDGATAAEVTALRDASFATEDFREGLEAFAEKRTPRWSGR